jgi:hypothetical protein
MPLPMWPWFGLVHLRTGTSSRTWSRRAVFCLLRLHGGSRCQPRPARPPPGPTRSGALVLAQVFFPGRDREHLDEAARLFGVAGEVPARRPGTASGPAKWFVACRRAACRWPVTVLDRHQDRPRCRAGDRRSTARPGSTRQAAGSDVAGLGRPPEHAGDHCAKRMDDREPGPQPTPRQPFGIRRRAPRYPCRDERRDPAACPQRPKGQNPALTGHSVSEGPSRPTPD